MCLTEILKVEFPQPTDAIRNLSRKDAEDGGREVILHGFLGSRDDLSKTLSFVPLFNKSLDCTIQIVSAGTGKRKAAHTLLKTIGSGSPVVVTGRVKERDGSKVRESTSGPIGKITCVEVLLLDIQLLNEFPKGLVGSDHDAFTAEDRHLQIRTNKDLRDSLSFRSKVAIHCRKELNDHGFIEIETPLLFKSTPEGAREFIVPTRQQGLAYALPQSPQQFKQILMGSGIPKYYQIAKCFRDEDLRADRQPEFTQLDLEMSFATGTDVMNCISVLVSKLWKDLLNVVLPDSFPNMTYSEAMSFYGSDKPDLRFPERFVRVDHILPTDLINKLTDIPNPIIEAFKLDLEESSNEDEDAVSTSQKFVNNFLNSPDAVPFHNNSSGAPGVFIYNPRAPLRGLSAFGFEAASSLESLLSPDEGSLIILQARSNTLMTGGSTPLGNIRSHLLKRGMKQGLLKPSTPFAPVWIVDFPLFTPTSTSAAEPGQGGTAGLSSTHHPFTSPGAPKDVDLLLTSPQDAIADHYDLVINGVELGGGSRRIHNADFQTFILRDVLKMSDERLKDFDHLIKVLRAGCPPHAGFALGFDRLVALMRGKESVRDVIAFPKGGDGSDKLMGSPARMREEELERYGLKLKI